MIDIIPEKQTAAKIPLGLYIHIPFCVKKCVYCDFLSHPVGADCTEGFGIYMQRYIRALCTEIESYRGMSDSRRIQTIYIGGGTPSLLEPDDITLVMNAVRSTFDVAADAEISIEVNPGTLTGEKAESYIQNGINRMSIGLQSADDSELAALGRIHNYDQFLASYNTARNAGFRNINIDLMACIPGQTMRSYLATLERVMRCRPEHISAYSLIVEDGTPLAGNGELLSAIADEDTDREMYEITKRLLGGSGYGRYEISNYARHGFECRHNIVYWTLGQYIGVGIGAASFVNGRRYSVTRDIEEYMDCMDECAGLLRGGSRMHEDESISRLLGGIRYVDETVNAERLMEEYMFLGLRMIKGVSAEEFNDRFGHSIYDVYGGVIERYVQSGHMAFDRGIIRLTDKGLDICNTIMADFLL